MPRTTAPLLSFDARGQIAKTQVYSSWRGLPYVRRYVIPNNPNTTGQQSTRNIFRTLNQMWLFAPAELTAVWDLYAQGRPFLGRNAFIGQNTRRLRSPTPDTDLTDMIAVPGAKGGLPPTSVVITPATTSLSFAVGFPAVPADWTLVGSHAVVTPDQDPADDFSGLWFSNSESGSTSPNVVTGLTTATDYYAALWLEWTKADDLPAYSVSLSQLITTS